MPARRRCYSSTACGNKSATSNMLGVGGPCLCRLRTVVRRLLRTGSPLGVKVSDMTLKAPERKSNSHRCHTELGAGGVGPNLCPSHVAKHSAIGLCGSRPWAEGVKSYDRIWERCIGERSHLGSMKCDVGASFLGSVRLVEIVSARVPPSNRKHHSSERCKRAHDPNLA